MIIRRILIVQSVHDRITARRIQHIQESALLQAFLFEHCFVIELTEHQKLLPVELMMQEIFQQPLNQRDLFERLGRQINAFQPDLVMIFYGAILHHFADAFIAVIENIKINYPRLRIGIASPQIPRAKIPNVGIFDDADEIRELANQIFPPSLSLGWTQCFSRN
jgi:hypothetical protein